MTISDPQDGPAIGGDAQLEKKPVWSTPKLLAYGSVRVLTMGMNGSQADMNNFTKNNQAGMSDPRAKENILSMGRHPLGFGLYLFSYRKEFRDTWGHERQFGVMADEVQEVLPDAVFLCSCGFRLVDYAVIAAASGGNRLHPRS